MGGGGDSSDSSALQPFPPAPSHPSSQPQHLSLLPGHVQQLQTVGSFTFQHLPSSGSPSAGGRPSRGHHSRKSSLSNNNNTIVTPFIPSVPDGPNPQSPPTRVSIAAGSIHNKVLPPPPSPLAAVTIPPTSPPTPSSSHWFFPITSSNLASPPPQISVDRGLSRTEGGVPISPSPAPLAVDNPKLPTFGSLSLPNSPPHSKPGGLPVPLIFQASEKEEEPSMVPRSSSMPINTIAPGTLPEPSSRNDEALTAGKDLPATPQRPTNHEGATSPSAAASSSFLSYFIPTLPTMMWTSPSPSQSPSSHPPTPSSHDPHPHLAIHEGEDVGPASSHQPPEEKDLLEGKAKKRRRKDITLSPLGSTVPLQPSPSAISSLNPTLGSGARPALPYPLLQGLLQDLNEKLGVVHLGLYPARSHLAAAHGSGSGLVVQWKREVMAVVCPGSEASR